MPIIYYIQTTLMVTAAVCIPTFLLMMYKVRQYDNEYTEYAWSHRYSLSFDLKFLFVIPRLYRELRAEEGKGAGIIYWTCVVSGTVLLPLSLFIELFPIMLAGYEILTNNVM